jgi:signal transduction histidine kinase
MFFCIFTANAQNKVRLTDDEYSVLRKDILDNYAKYPLDAVDRANYYIEKYANKFTLRQQLRIYYTKAYYQIQAELFEEAYQTLTKCKELADILNEPQLTYYFYSYMAGMFNSLENFDLSIEAYLKALDVAQSTNDKAMIARAHNNVGHGLIELQRYDQARPYIEFFYQYGKQALNGNYISTALNNFGELALGENNLGKAKLYFNESLDIRLGKGHELSSSWPYHNLGRAHYQLADYQKAEQYLLQAISIRNKYERELEEIRSSLELVKVYFATDQDQKAYPMLMQAIDKLKAKKNLQLLSKAYQSLKGYYLKQQNYQQALTVGEDLLVAKVTLAKRQFDLSLTHYLTKIDMNIKEMDNQALRKENQLSQQKIQSNQQLILIVVVMSSVTLIIVLGFLRSLTDNNKKLKSTIVILDKTRGELIEAEKMSAITTLVSGMAHQLNNPIGIILTANSAVHDKLDTLGEQVSKRNLNQQTFENALLDMQKAITLSENNCQKAADLITQFRHISAELEGAEVSHFPLKLFLQTKLQLITSQYHNITKYEVIGNELNIENYESVLFKVLEKLVKNTAENITPETSLLTISIHIKVNADNISLIYRDNGSGIADNIRDKIFDPFFTTKGMQKSMGLGLNIAYNSVHHLMQGALCCEPSKTGAKFILQLPLTFKAKAIS